MMNKTTFEWNESKNNENLLKHNVSFFEAQFAFFDEKRIIAEDVTHSGIENRFYCFGKNRSGSGILTVRFTYRANHIRIIGAGYLANRQKSI